MGYFNFFIKQLIRIFTRKFFWVILVFLFLFFVLFNENIFAATRFVASDYYFSDTDITNARNKIGEAIWNNNNYDIILIYNPGSIGKHYIYFDSSSLPNNTIYRINTASSNTFFNMYVKPFGFFNKDTMSSSGLYVTDFHYAGIYTSNEDDYLSQLPVDTTSSNNYLVNMFETNYNIYFKPIRSHFNFVDVDNSYVISSATNVSPFIVNSSEVSNWSFDNLIISLGSLTYDFSNYYGLVINNGYDNVIDLFTYYNSNDNTFVIPKNQLSNFINIRDGNIIDFELSYRSMTSVNLFDLGNYSISLTTEEENNINQDSEKYVQGQILEEQQKTIKAVENVDNSVNNLNNSINDSSVDDITSGDLPSDNTEDITAEGVNGIFTSIYNAFCTGTAQDIVFPIPFTNKNITLSANYVNDMLSSSGASWVITIIQAFWWYLISRFIIKDVINKINKIKSGNIEDIETTNIRGDML